MASNADFAGLAHSWELYTHRGRMLASHLLPPIAEDVTADRLTRKGAVERICAAIHEISSIDDGMSDSDPFYAVAHFFKPAFAKAGYVPLSGDDLMDAYHSFAKGREKADGSRYFNDESWFDPAELAFYDTCELIDTVQGKRNNVAHYGRSLSDLPEGIEFASTAGAGFAILVGGEAPFSVTFAGNPVQAGDERIKFSHTVLTQAFEQLFAAVDAANKRLAGEHGEGFELSVTKHEDEEEARRLTLTYQGEPVNIFRPTFPRQPSAGPSM